MVRVVQPLTGEIDKYWMELARVAMSLKLIYRGQVEVFVIGETIEDLSWIASAVMINPPTRVTKDSLDVVVLDDSICFVSQGGSAPEWLTARGVSEIVVPNDVELESTYLGTWTYPRFSWIGEFLEKEYGLRRSV